jgi:hypothetical protein
MGAHISFYDAITGFACVKNIARGGHVLLMDLIALLCGILAVLAIAGFAIEFIFTGARDRLLAAAWSLVRR